MEDVIRREVESLQGGAEEEVLRQGLERVVGQVEYPE